MANRNVREEVVRLIIDGKQVTGSYNELQKAQREVKKNLKGMVQGSKEYHQEANKLNQINKQLDDQRKKINSIGKEWKSQKSLWERAKVTFAGTFAALRVQGAIAQVQRLGGQIVQFVKQLTKQRREITRLTGETGRDLDVTSSKIQSIIDTFDQGFDETLIAANTLAKSFSITLPEALDLMQNGFANGANASGEFLNILKQYPTQLSAAGLSAEQSIALIQNQVKSGVFSDKGIDSIKEATIRLREMTKATREALEGIGLSSEQLEKDLRANTITYFDAIQLVSEKLNELEEQSPEVGTAIADIFGGAGEDAGLAYLKTLSDVQTELDKTETATTRLARANERLALAYQKYADDEGLWSDIKAGWANFRAFWLETSHAFANQKTQMDELAVAAAMAGKNINELTTVAGIKPEGDTLLKELNDQIINLDQLSKEEINAFLTKLRTAQQETKNLSKEQIQIIRNLREQFSAQLDFLNKPKDSPTPSLGTDPNKTPGSTSEKGKTNLPSIGNVDPKGMGEVSKILADYAGEVETSENAITETLATNISERIALREREHQLMKEQNAEALALSITTNMMEAQSGQQRLEMIKQNVMGAIKARIASSVAAQLEKVILTVPFPINILIASGAAAAVSQLFDSLIPSFYEGGDTGRQTMGFGDKYGGFTGMTHADEFVIPKAQRDDPYVANTERYIESRKKYGPAGQMGSSGTGQMISTTAELDSNKFDHSVDRMINFFTYLEKKGLPAYFTRRTFENANEDYQDKEKNRNKGSLRG